MANSLTVSLNVSLSDGTNKESFVPPRFSNTPSTYNFHKTVWTVGTSAENMPTGDVAANRFVGFKNLDSTNYVTIGPDSSGQVDMLKLLPGDFAWLPLKAGVTIKGTANTAACKVMVFLTDSTT